MRWCLSWRADPRAARLADEHYSRRTVGAAQFTPPGRVVVLLTEPADALWVTWHGDPQYIDHEYAADAWVCSIFRNTGEALSSELIVEALAATRAQWDAPPADGTLTFVDGSKVRRKRDPGYCFLRAGFERVATTPGGHGRNPLAVLRLRAELHPGPVAPWLSQGVLL